MPGLIGNLGGTLGDAGINIASFHLGRHAEGQGALALVAVDQPVPEPVIDTVRGLSSVVQVRGLQF